MEGLKAAPGRLELVREFVNTLDIEEGVDALSSPDALVGWLSDRGLAAQDTKASRADLQSARELREATRARLLAHTERAPVPDQVCAVVDGAALRARLVPRLDPGGTSALVPEAAGVDGALGRLLAIIHEAVADGTWPRLKACREDTCQWAFYDNTKNRSGAWCSMAVCGNRAKARAYRQRRGHPH